MYQRSRLGEIRWERYRRDTGTAYLLQQFMRIGMPISYIFFVRKSSANSELGPQHMPKRVRQSTYPCGPDDNQQSTTLVTKEIF
jgi:hypothetical protein